MSYSMSIDMDRSDNADAADLAAQTGGIYAQVRYGVDDDERRERLAAARPPDEEDEEDYDDEMDEDDYDDEELDGALLEEGIPFYMSETDETFAYEVDEEDDDDDDDDFIVEEEEEQEEEDDEEEYSDDSDGEYGQRVYLSFLTTNGRRSGKSRLSQTVSALPARLLPTLPAAPTTPTARRYSIPIICDKVVIAGIQIDSSVY
ncbi:hypothetical protein V1520DRAFT_165382 [Lipomyces starkeyi]|uniref:Uncharacterized protein n=1 Tax=Lipomyces starkeyi NRRL Y-11557 TaxID=675824 RepID=A0A1E3Q9Y9_LIPST|nr:hypothetical protein LIPSTDRAFT_62503 [Lipomyces starkeyi NRRL Y-11557]